MKRAYDIVVIGAGAAGCAAARACALQHPNASIALLEQGSRAPVPAIMRVPLLQPFLSAMRKARPFLETIACDPEANLANRRLAYTRGRGLGGSSLCNDMTYMRGTVQDFADWQEPSWSYEQVLPVYKALEANARGDSLTHGEEGPLPVSDAQRSNIDANMNVRFFEACEAAGVAAIDDFNSGVADGFSAMQTYVWHGSRVDVFDSLLESTQHRTPGLQVLTDTSVEAIRCASGRVTGLDVRQGMELRQVEVGRVVVCAGALRTPLLLQRSGIGKEGRVVDLPSVGKNLISPSAVDLVFKMHRSRNVSSKSVSWRNLPYLCQEWREYGEDRTGIFASFVEGAAYVRSRPDRDHADLSLRFFRTPQLGMAQWPQCWLMDGFSMRVTHHYPTSRGEVEYDAATNTARVRSGVLATKEDVLALDEGIQWVGLLTSRDGTLRSVYHVDEKEENVNPFWSYEATLHRPRGGLATQQDTAAFLAECTESTGDLFGTCAMHSVVDGRLQVRGVAGLYVADSSVVPVPTVASSTTVGTVIGTRVAQLMEV